LSQIPTNLDPNSGNPIGMGIPPVAASNGYRTTSATANLQNKPDNLTIWTSSPVAKVIFLGTRATGVQLIDGRTGTSSFLSFQNNATDFAQPTQTKK
jgi:choline dehydrogenase-like flavoprotein